MKRLFGLAMVPVVLAATPMLALAETPAHPHQPTVKPAQEVKHTQTRMHEQHTMPVKTLAADDRTNPQWVQGQWNLITRHYPEAVAAFQDVLTTEPQNVHALNGLAEALYYQGRYNEALPHIEKAVALDPINGRLFYTQAMILDAQDKPLEAMEAYLTFTSLDPDDGAALMALRRVEELHKRVQPTLSEAWRNYLQGLRMLSLHQPDKAIPLFERYQAMEPENHQATLLLGRAYLELGQPDQAIPLFQSTLKMQANNPEAYYQLAHIYEMRGETQSAHDAWRKFLQFAPQSESAMLINRRFEYRQQ